MSVKTPLYFEGTEKKFEFAIDTALPSLRELGTSYWERVARACRARVLSRLENERCEAYLLSESSLFVFDHKVLMITCGKTRLCDAVFELLCDIPGDQVTFFAYERKNEVFPHDQPTSFFEDVKRLNRSLPGRAFKFGDEDDHHLYVFHLSRPFEAESEDGTIELLMYGLDGEARRVFSSGSGDTATARRFVDLGDLLQGYQIDDHLFDPAGYSLNAIRDDEYWTLHVTPNDISSYASFETNHRFSDEFDPLIGRLLEVFKPRAFDLVRFERRPGLGFTSPAYRVKSHVEEDLDCGYRVRFMSYYRPIHGVERPTELPVR